MWSIMSFLDQSCHLIMGGVGRWEVLTKILTLNIIVCVHDKIFCVIRKNELQYEPGQGGEKD